MIDLLLSLNNVLIKLGVPAGISLWAKRSIWLQFGVGILRQIGHHWLFVQIGIDQFFGFDQLQFQIPDIIQEI